MKNKKLFRGTGCAVFLILAAVCVSSAQEGGTDEDAKIRQARERYNAGKELMAQGDFTAANEAFKNAQQCLGGGAVEPGASAVEGRTSLSPAVSASEYLKRARESDKKGEFKEAVENYRKAAEYTPRNADIHYNAGVEFLKLRQYTEAAKAFQYVIELNPRDKDAYYNLGIVYDAYLDDKDKALGYYLRYLSLAPYGPEAESVKAAVALIRGRSGKK
jgi:tetratricopeptide (TPR) repeat protein